jgi:hypothetical protein
MKKTNFIWVGVIIFLFFQLLSAYSSEITPSTKAVGEEELIGDLNLNLLPYEPADFGLFLSYFMEGTSVFAIDSALQIANSDIDGDGEVLTLSDFVLMNRIMLSAAKPGDTTGYSDKIAYYYTTSVSDSILLFSFGFEAPGGALLFTFDCSDTLAVPYLYSTDMDLIYEINNNELRVLIFSLGGTNIPSGPVVDLLAIPLENACTLTSLEVVDEKGNVMETRECVEFLRGDANTDGAVSVSDVVYLISSLFKGGPAPDPSLAGDTNCDGEVTVSDVVYLINYLFKGGPAPCI